MSEETILTSIETLLSELPIAERESVIELIENYGDMRADIALRK
jgi:hypothetical protein